MLKIKNPQGLIQYIFPYFGIVYFNPNYMMEWAILAPKNEDVDDINEQLWFWVI